MVKDIDLHDVECKLSFMSPAFIKGMYMTTSTTMPFDLDEFVSAAIASYTTDKVTDAVSKAADSGVAEMEARIPEKVEAPKPVLTAGAGEALFSTLFGVVPKNISDFKFKLFADVPSHFAWHIPKADEHYVVQAEEAARLVAAIEDGDRVLMTGPTGSGKSSLVKYVCAKIGAPFIRINMSTDAESSVLFGQMTARDGSTHWIDGPITEAVLYGGVVLIDEWELMPAEISMGLQNLLEDDGYLFLKEKPGTSEEKTLIPHKNFRIVCGGNTVGQGDDSGSFSGTMVQNSATIDRFTTTIRLDYLDAKHETDVVNGRTGVAKSLIGKMLKLASLVRSAAGQRAINLTMSPRTLINWANKYKRYGNMEYAFRVAFLDKLRDSDKKAVCELYTKVFGVAL